MERLIRRTCNALPHGDCRKVTALAKRIRQFLGGSRVCLTLTSCDLSGLGRFQKRVLLLEKRIPRGSVSTYKILAQKLGMPNHARAVGRALAKNPFPVIIPCHRIIKADRSLGGYAGGVNMKRRLLEMEGVRFDRCGRAVVKKFWWK
jgi:methylated-DNA-[protein]-cysteine S-methyltransferase